MNKLTSLLVLAAFAGAATAPLSAQQKRISPHETISLHVGNPRSGPLVAITYGRPYSKDPKTGATRKIWGTLVPWNKAYRLGADEATLLVTPEAMDLGGATIPAGAYTLYMVPSDTGPSKLAISTAIGKWGIPVDEKHDLARVDLKQAELPEPVDELTLALENDPATGGGVLKIMWEKTQYSVPFALKK